LKPERFDRLEVGGFACGVEAEEYTDGYGYAESEQYRTERYDDQRVIESAEEI